MTRTTQRRARRPRQCDTCLCGIDAGESYLEHVASPYHDDLNNPGWWRMSECAFCAERHGRAVA